MVNGRTQTAADKVAAELEAETGSRVVPVGADIDTEEGRQRLLAAVSPVDILVNNNSGPPFRDFREVGHGDLLAGVEANMATPVRLVQGVIDGMVQRRFGRIVNITSSSVRMPLAGLDLSSGARLGLTGFLAGVARSVVQANVTINFLLPGSFDTDRLQEGHRRQAEQSSIPVQTFRAAARERIPARRFGVPEELGAACAFLCSVHAGYITGQSLLIDGGVYPGVL